MGRARFKAAEVNGVYILITKDPGYLQIEVGNVTAERTFTMDNRDHLEALMLKDFKAKDYDKGLLDGVKYVQASMNANLKAKPAAPTPGGAATDQFPESDCAGEAVTPVARRLARPPLHRVGGDRGNLGAVRHHPRYQRPAHLRAGRLR